MPRKARKGRLGLVVVGENNAFELTDVGLATVREMAAIGSDPVEIDNYLMVSKGWLQTRLDEDGPQFDAAIAEAFEEGISEFKGRIRVAQMNLGEVNASMAIHLGRQFLNQKDGTVEHNHTLRVIGTLPDFKNQSGDDWSRQFAPESTRVIAQQKENVVDLAYEEVDAPGKNAHGGN